MPAKAPTRAYGLFSGVLGRRLLSCPFLRAEPVGVELSPVVAQGSLEMRRVADALLYLGQVLRGVVAGRPVGPDPVDEREVIGPDDLLGHPLILEVPEV